MNEQYNYPYSVQEPDNRNKEASHSGFVKGIWAGLAIGVIATTFCAILVGALAREIRGNDRDYSHFDDYDDYYDYFDYDSSAIDDETIEKLETIQNRIDGDYLRDYDRDAMQEGICKGFVSGLGDPYSQYYDAEETSELFEGIEGNFSGIGAMLQQDPSTGIITVIRVYNDSPAERAGVLKDDIIYKVEGEEVTGQDLTEVVSHIRGEEGTEVNLTVLRGSEEVEITATRARIEVETVDYEMLDGSIGYIAVTEFDAVTQNQFKEALDDLKSQGMKGLVIDLRDNPGGLVDVTCSMLDELLPEGLLVYTEDKYGERDEYRSEGNDELGVPLVVLVNENSASASEIFASAIKGNNAGTIVGTQTFGKGVIQEQLDLGDGTCLKLTIAEYFSPDGTAIDGQGVEPDVVVEAEDGAATAAETEDGKEAEVKDVQLEKALEVVKKGK